MGIRILQLLERHADSEALRSARQLRDGLGAEYTIAIETLAGAGAAAILRGMYLLGRKRHQWDRVHAWGPTALAAAAAAWNGPIIHSPAAAVTPASLRWLRAAMAYRDIRVICPTATQQHQCLQSGIAPDRCLLIRPGVDFAKLRRRRNPALRQRLGLREDDFVLLAAGESTPEANHLQAIWAAGILHVLDRRYKIILWGRGEQIDNIRRRGLNMGAPQAMRYADRLLGLQTHFEDLLPAADLVLAPAEGSVRTLEIAMAMGAGLPIVATASAVVSELLEDRHTALMTPTAHPRLIAKRVLEFRENPALQWQLADRARAEAYDFFSQSRFLDEYRALNSTAYTAADSYQSSVPRHASVMASTPNFPSDPQVHSG